MDKQEEVKVPCTDLTKAEPGQWVIINSHRGLNSEFHPIYKVWKDGRIALRWGEGYQRVYIPRCHDAAWEQGHGNGKITAFPAGVTVEEAMAQRQKEWDAAIAEGERKAKEKAEETRRLIAAANIEHRKVDGAGALCLAFWTDGHGRRMVTPYVPYTRSRPRYDTRGIDYRAAIGVYELPLEEVKDEERGGSGSVVFALNRDSDVSSEDAVNQWIAAHFR